MVNIIDTWMAPPSVRAGQACLLGAGVLLLATCIGLLATRKRSSGSVAAGATALCVAVLAGIVGAGLLLTQSTDPLPKPRTRKHVTWDKDLERTWHQQTPLKDKQMNKEEDVEALEEEPAPPTTNPYANMTNSQLHDARMAFYTMQETPADRSAILRAEALEAVQQLRDEPGAVRIPG